MIDISASVTVNGVSYITDVNGQRKDIQSLQATITPDGGMSVTKYYIDHDTFLKYKDTIASDASDFEEKAINLADKLYSETKGDN